MNERARRAGMGLAIIGLVVAIVFLVMNLPASAHHVIDVSASVNCDGYSVSASANVYDNHRLVVRIDTTDPFDGADGVNVYNEIETGGNHDVNVGPFAGPETKGFVQVIIFSGPATLNVEDSQTTTFENDQDCETTTTTAPEEPTTTTLPEETTTTLEPTTTTEPTTTSQETTTTTLAVDSTSTSTSPSTSIPPSGDTTAPPSGPTLPFTGPSQDAGMLALLALGFLGLGCAGLVTSRRMMREHEEALDDIR